MNLNIIDQFNIFKQCQGYGISLWQCPQFLFVIMGVIIIITSVLSYFVGNRYINNPGLVALIDLIISIVLFVISFIITKNFEALAEASQMKSEFINIISHQLRSPITNIKWILDFLTSDDVKIEKRKKQEYFEKLEENASRMSELVDNLLIAGKIEQGDFPLSKKESSLKEITETMINKSKILAEASRKKLEFHCEKKLPKSFFDPTLIKLVVENLIDNAIRYTKKQGKIIIRLRKSGKNLLFEIQDNGVGIAQKDKKHIFKKFFRADNPLKEKTKGSGLGLYIAKKIVERSNGKIWFDSKENKGTTFYFTLPIK